MNLERALRLSDRLGGHLVTGHIDGTGTLAATSSSGDFSELTFRAGPEILDYSVHKGSIAVDGVSLQLQQDRATGALEHRSLLAFRPQLLDDTPEPERRGLVAGLVDALGR